MTPTADHHARTEKEADPTAPTTMTVAIDNIKPYDHNPRHAPNERYTEIKTSIAARGLDMPLPITRRPSDAHYIIGKGGNTRLKILGELYEETGDQRFYNVRCDFTPWVSDTDVLIAHLSENEHRGELVFIDRARGVRQLRTLMEADGGETLVMHDFIQRMQVLGYSLSKPWIQRMNYALDVLLPAMPHALGAGLGRRHIDAIRRLDNAARRVWTQAGIEDDFGPIFTILLQRHDREDWTIEPLQQAVIKEIEVTAEQSPISIAAALAQALSSRSSAPVVDLSVPDTASEARAAPLATDTLPITPITEEPPEKPTASSTAPAVAPPVVRQPAKPPASAPVATPASAPILDQWLDAPPDELETWITPDPLPETATQPSDADAGTDLSSSEIATLGDIDILLDPARRQALEFKPLRDTAWTLAARLIRRNALDDLIAPCNGGCGYLLMDAPAPTLATTLTPTQFATTTALWWQLLTYADMQDAPQDWLLPLLPATSLVRSLLLEQNPAVLEPRLAPIHPGFFGQVLWRCVDTRDWSDLRQLQATYRSLHELADEQQLSLWEATT